MKFGKHLQCQLEDTIPEWRDKYLSYKQLKKRLKLVSAPVHFTRLSEYPLPHEGWKLVPNSVDDASDQESTKWGKQPREQQGESLSVPGIWDAVDGNVTPADSQHSSVHENRMIAEGGAKGSISDSDGASVSEPNFIAHMKNLTEEELDFIHLLNSELEKFNIFFTEKEEEYVIRLQVGDLFCSCCKKILNRRPMELKERIERIKEEKGPNGKFSSESELNEEMIEIRRDFVNFHGEMVLLENYSSVNYTGLVKILKKHDKRTGALLRMPFIQNVLHQPFFTTEILSKLVCECEMNLQSLFPSSHSSFSQAPTTLSCHMQQDNTAQKDAFDPEVQGIPFFHGDDMESIQKSTMAALRTMKEMQKGSSTYNVFSLPYGLWDSDGNTLAPCCMTISICPKR